jgi:hypothetical protein
MKNYFIRSVPGPVLVITIGLTGILFCMGFALYDAYRPDRQSIAHKIEIWLPKDADQGAGASQEEIRVTLQWRPEIGQTCARICRLKRSFEKLDTDILYASGSSDGTRPEFQELAALDLSDGFAGCAPVIIDAEAGVPWQDVITVVDACKNANDRPIEFAPPVVALGE